MLSVFRLPFAQFPIDTARVSLYYHYNYGQEEE